MHKSIEIGGRAIRLAPLSFRKLELLKDQVDLLMGAGANFMLQESRDAIVAVLLASVDDPAITQDWLLDSLNIVNFPEAMRAVFDGNGFIAD
ncbi:MAG: hypothetical protein JSR70_07530, partial [Proteobacteria bacterium]|nr:hypothetical protein [Pseudomonadota bacterium]